MPLSEGQSIYTFDFQKVMAYKLLKYKLSDSRSCFLASAKRQSCVPKNFVNSVGKMGFKKSYVRDCLYIGGTASGISYLVALVDDILFMGR